MKGKVCQCLLCWHEGVVEDTRTYTSDPVERELRSTFPPGWRMLGRRLVCDKCFKSYREWVQSRQDLAPKADHLKEEIDE